MIGSFWNLCRACPSMPVDKLHSEYRSTYRWHEYTGNSRPEVVRKPPVPNQFASSTDHFFSKSMEDEKSIEGPTNEPPLPRRKKCPELAYRTHDFISGSDHAPPSSQANYRNDSKSVTRARSEERGTPSRRSKSEGPPGVANGRAYPYENGVAEKQNGIVPEKAGESSGLFKKTITKLSTEYRLQFVWPHVRKAIKGDANNTVDTPRKSLSMGAIKSSQTNAMPTVHKKRTANEKEATSYELEPLVNDAAEERKPAEKHVSTIEHKTSRPFTQMADQERHHHNLTRKENFGFSEEKKQQSGDSKLLNGTVPANEEWYKDVIELRKKAGEYKCRGWGIEIDPELYKKQKELWDQVSRRSSLSALSLASSVHRPITKEEKEQENNKKSSPTKSARGRIPGHAHLFDNKTIPDGPILPARVQTIRHHLERTTGPDVEEGALLPSPTREKLMPTVPKSKESEPYSSQRGSPKKSATSRHGSPQKGSPQKGSPKKTVKGRSQSVGPSVIDANESPKRQIRSVSQAPSAAKANKKTPVSTPTIGERRPRPSTLSTSTHSRSKSSSLPPSGRVHSTSGNHHIQSISQNDTNKTSTTAGSGHGNTNQSQATMRSKNNKSTKSTLRPKSAIVNGPAINEDPMTASMMIISDVQTVPKIQDLIKLAENDEEQGQDKDGGVSIASHSPQPPQVEFLAEHIVKSPPEPTRVKSPEQIIMRSPDPVNWTVPLDTGKTFTVTQNVKDGENFSRPQSEVKVSTPVERPPPAPQSAPPELAEQAKMEAWKKSNSDRNSSGGPSPTGLKRTPEIRYDKPVPGTTLRCLDDPSFESAESATIRTTAVDVLEKARDRFDRFWGGSKEENV